MPALIGGFGKSKIQMHNYTTLESPIDQNNLESLRNKFPAPRKQLRSGGGEKGSL